MIVEEFEIEPVTLVLEGYTDDQINKLISLASEIRSNPKVFSPPHIRIMTATNPLVVGNPSTSELHIHGLDPMKAAIFLATISADPERAAMFKMFWGGE